MRRQTLLDRLLRESRSGGPHRYVPRVEELESREVLSITVYVPEFGSPPQTLANQPFTLGGEAENGFYVDNSTDPYGTDTYQAILTATHGTIAVDPAYAASNGVSVTNNGTPSVTLVGTLYNIDDVIGEQETYQPAYYYNGDAFMGLTVSDQTVPSTPPGSGSLDVQVLPVASDPAFTVRAPGEIPAPSSGFAFPPGFVSVAPWPDTNGTVTVTFALGANNAGEYTLLAGGAPLTPTGTGQWQVASGDPAALQAELDSLVLVPPSGYSGRATLTVSATLVDQTYFNDESSASSSQFLGSYDVALRFYLGGSVTAQPASGSEGGTLDLGGLYRVSDPDQLPGDTETLTLSVPQGTLSFNAAAVPTGATVTGGGPTVTVTGTINGINAFLVTPGSLTYSADDPHFAGTVPIALTLTLQPGPPPSDPTEPAFGPPPVGATSDLTLSPVADPVYPVAGDVTTPESTPVPLVIGLSEPAGIDGTESVAIRIDGVPSGASFDHGTNLGNGAWAFAPADLVGLTFDPPTGTTGAVALDVQVVGTNSVPGFAPVAVTESTTFTVTVIPPSGTAATHTTTTPQLPPESDVPIAFVFSPGAGTGDALDSGGSGTEDSSPVEALARAGLAFVSGYASSGTSESPAVATETRTTTTALGSLFVPVEAPLPSYALGERHPLPPVLPLDPTSPGAGFTESGGDSFALVDKLYRDAAGPAAAAVSRAVPAPDPKALADASHEQVTRILLGTAPANVASDPAAPAPAPAGEDGGAGGAWRAAAAAVAVTGVLVAWLGRGPDGLLARSVRRFLRTARRSVPSPILRPPLGAPFRSPSGYATSERAI